MLQKYYTVRRARCQAITTCMNADNSANITGIFRWYYSWVHSIPLFSNSRLRDGWFILTVLFPSKSWHPNTTTTTITQKKYKVFFSSKKSLSHSKILYNSHLKGFKKSRKTVKGTFSPYLIQPENSAVEQG